MQAANDAEKASVEKGIDAWKKIVAAAPAAWAPKRELARVYKKAERWNAFIEVMKDAVEKANWSSPEDKIPVLFEMIEVYRDPSDGQYQRIEIMRRGDRLQPLAFPDISIAVDDVLI